MGGGRLVLVHEALRGIGAHGAHAGGGNLGVGRHLAGRVGDHAGANELGMGAQNGVVVDHRRGQVVPGGAGADGGEGVGGGDRGALCTGGLGKHWVLLVIHKVLDDSVVTANVLALLDLQPREMLGGVRGWYPYSTAFEGDHMHSTPPL